MSRTQRQAFPEGRGRTSGDRQDDVLLEVPILVQRLGRPLGFGASLQPLCPIWGYALTVWLQHDKICVDVHVLPYAVSQDSKSWLIVSNRRLLIWRTADTVQD